MSEKKEVLLRIRIDEEAAKKKIVDFQKEINAAKKEQQELSAAIKAAGTVTDEQAAKQVELKARLKDLTQQQNLQIRAVESQQKADKAAQGSIVQLRAQLASLTDDWNNLSEEERENADIGGKVEKATKAVSDKLKELEGRVGDTRRNVGNYTQSILQAADGSGKLSTAISTAQEAYDELKGFISDAKKALEDEVKAKIAAKNAALAKAAAEQTGAAVTGAATTATNINKAAIIGNVAALKLLKFALYATGIGAVLLLLGGLISFLTRTQEGIDLVSRKTAGFTTVIGVLIDNLSAVGKRVIDFVSGFENLGDAVKKLGKLLLDNLISRFKGLGVIIEGIINRDFSKIQDGIVQVGTGITDATAKTKAFAKELNEARKAGEAIEKENQRLRDSERALNVEREKANAQIEKYKLVAEDTTKSEAERADAARKAFALEESLREKQLQLQRDKIANLVAEQKLTNNLTEDNDKLAAAQVELARIERESVGKSIELQNKLNALRKEGSDKAAARAKELSEKEYAALQKKLADEKAVLELALLQTVDNSEKQLQATIKLNEKEREIALSAKELTAAQAALIQAQYDKKELEARKAFALKQIELEKEAQEKRKKAIEDQAKQLQEAEQIIAGNQELDALNRYAAGETFEYQHQERLQQIQRESLQRQLEEAKRLGLDTLEIERKIAEDKIAVRLQEAERKAAIQQVEYQTAVTASQALGDLATIVAGQSAEAGEFAKAITLFQLGIDTARALSAITASSAQVAASIAAASGPAGLVTGPAAYAAYYATNVATVLANIAQAKQLLTAEAPQPKGFAEGGYTGNGYGTPDASGYRVAGVVHEGEYVVPNWQVKRNAGLIASLEQHRQRGYAAGGYTGSSLPPSVRQAMGGVPLPIIDYDRLGQSVGKYVPRYIKTTDIKGGLAKDQQTARVVNQ
ncbi:hypothetical protein OB13_15005 [Pontibacter sp. HJ8]